MGITKNMNMRKNFNFIKEKISPENVSYEQKHEKVEWTSTIFFITHIFLNDR